MIDPCGDRERVRKRNANQRLVVIHNKATGLECHVSKPYGESSPYDFVVEHLKRLSKVQVKSTTYMHIATGGYQVNSQRVVSGTSVANCTGDVDFFAFHVAPRDVWYIVPFSEIGGNLRVCCTQTNRRAIGASGNTAKPGICWKVLGGARTLCSHSALTRARGAPARGADSSLAIRRAYGTRATRAYPSRR